MQHSTDDVALLRKEATLALEGSASDAALARLVELGWLEAAVLPSPLVCPQFLKAPLYTWTDAAIAQLPLASVWADTARRGEKIAGIVLAVVPRGGGALMATVSSVCASSHDSDDAALAEAQQVVDRWLASNSALLTRAR